jgi:hypothetical protein
VRGLFVWHGGSITGAFAPKVASTSRLYSDPTLPSVDPMFDRTNASNRFLLKTTLDLIGDFSPELAFYDDGGTLRFGLNLTQSFGKKIVGYVEWAGGSQSSIAQEALSYGALTGSLPSFVASGATAGFQNDLAAGLSYATESKQTFWVEYHLHQAGFSRQDWGKWFDEGSSAQLAPLLWYIRGYAQEQQAPVTKHRLFVRADWTDAFLFNLELTGFALIDLYDGSTLAQLTANYVVSTVWSVALLGSANLGARRSEFGSLPASLSGLLSIKLYF